jgi:curved DNA-binding protein CbpA
MALPNYYDILEVPFDADTETIRRTFHDTARQCQPDEKKEEWAFDFALITEAYKTLRDPARRESYDRALRAENPKFAKPERISVFSRRGDVPAVGSNGFMSPAIIGSAILIRGTLSSEQDLVLKGEVEGPIRVPEHKLHIGQTGKATPKLEVAEADIAGTFVGELRATVRVILRKTAHVQGRIRTPALAIEDGAYCAATIEMP